jgi:anti-sigma factor RsiW
MNAIDVDMHAIGDELALYVLNALEPAARQRLESHVAGCASCAEELAAEAAAELELEALWPQLSRPVAAVVALAPRASVPQPAACPAPAARGRSVLPTLAAAAVALLFAGSWLHRPSAGREGDAMAFSSIAACFAPAAGMEGEGEAATCALDTDSSGSFAGLASWGMCGRPSAPAALCSAASRCTPR